MVDVLTSNGNVVLLGGAAILSDGDSGVTPVSTGVQFIDYDGTLIETWETSAVANKSALPSNPSHTGLTAQGWNWTLADIKSYISTYPKALLTVGQMYITSDGKTQIDIELDNPDLLTPYLKFAVNGTAVIDWGDGSTIDTVTGTSLTTSIYTPHTYSTIGSYTISIEVTSGSFQFYNNYILSPRVTNGDAATRYNSSIKAIRLGEGTTTIGTYAFNNCWRLQFLTLPNTITSFSGVTHCRSCVSLKTLTIPSGITELPTYMFYDCSSLLAISIPKSMTTIGTSAFNNCNSLTSLALPSNATSFGSLYGCSSLESFIVPDGVTTIGGSSFYSCYALRNLIIPNSVTQLSGNNVFQYCRSLQSLVIPSDTTTIGNSVLGYCVSLQSITIPSGVTSIGTQAFYACHSLYEIHFLSTTPPTVAGSNAWTNLPTDCKIYVPTGTLSDYTSATNYPDPATYTYIEE